MLDKEDVIKEIIKTLQEHETTGAISYSVYKELLSLTRQLQ